MTNSLEQMRHKIAGAEQLESVVRTMKAQAASSITQYENAVLALGDYTRTVELGLIACFHQNKPLISKTPDPQNITAIVFGSDQGLVGKFNDQLAGMVKTALHEESGTKTLWSVGARIGGHLNDAGLSTEKTFDVPASIAAITPLIGQILNECVRNAAEDDHTKTLIFYNRLQVGSIYEPTNQQLLPLDTAWQSGLRQSLWTGNALPEILEDKDTPLLSALMREHLFISLYRACAQSLASENASRLAAIDEELFDVIASYDGASRSYR